MRIGMIISNLIDVPPNHTTLPRGFSGAPEMISWELAEALVRRGHDVTLFASGASRTSARLVGFPSQQSSSYSRDMNQEKAIDFEYVLVASALEHARRDKFDIVHSQLPLRTAAFAPLFPCPVVATLHSVFSATQDFLRDQGRGQNYIAISRSQRASIPGLNYLATIHHGLDLSQFPFNQRTTPSLAFVGRLVPHKGAHVAIAIANKLKVRLDVFGDYSETYATYFSQRIKPYVSRNISLHGFVKRSQTVASVARSRALLLPIDWDEPFGLAMIEAMAVGTPVITFGRGSVPEIIKDGVTGFIIPPGDISLMTKTVQKLFAMSAEEYVAMRRACREHVRQNFTLAKMTTAYIRAYTKLLNR